MMTLRTEDLTKVVTINNCTVTITDSLLNELDEILHEVNPCEWLCDRGYLDDYKDDNEEVEGALNDYPNVEWFIWDTDNGTICTLESDEDVKGQIERVKSYLD